MESDRLTAGGMGHQAIDKPRSSAILRSENETMEIDRPNIKHTVSKSRLELSIGLILLFVSLLGIIINLVQQ
ncbi:MAG: hypothetical protein ACREIQ_12280 [Nitrospiria bacterium]